MAKQKADYPGKNQLSQAMNCIGSLIFERAIDGNLDFSVSSRRIGAATILSVYHPDGVMQFTITDEERQAEDRARVVRRERAKKLRSRKAGSSVS